MKRIVKRICSIALCSSFVWLNLAGLAKAETRVLNAKTVSKNTPKPKARPGKIKFVAPNDVGDPGGRGRGGGSRGNCEKYQDLTAIVPQDPQIAALTTETHPTLWFYIPTALPDGASIAFTLRDQADNDLYTNTFKPDAMDAGIIRITIPSKVTPLNLQQPYRWSLSVFCEAQNPKASVFVNGTIRRTSLPNDIQRAVIAAQDPSDRAILYAKYGIWHDAVTALGVARGKSETIDGTWSDLLAAANLSRLDPALMLPCCTATATSMNPSDPKNVGIEPIDRDDERLVLKDLGLFYKQQNKLPTAIAFYKQSVNLAEATRQKITGQQQAAFIQGVARDYRVLADLLLLEGRILEAQQILELMKIQEIREFTRNAKASDALVGIATTATEEKIIQDHRTLITLGEKVYDCKRSQCTDLSRLNNQFKALTEEYNQAVLKSVEKTSDRLAQDKAFSDPNKFLPKALAIVDAQPHTLLIYPLVMKDKLWLVWASKGGVIKSVRLPVDQRQIGEVVVKFRQQLQSPMSNPKELKATGKILYDWLIKPLESELKANPIQNLVFSLDRTTRYIPMGALYDGEKYLAENYNISTILSADLTDMGNYPSLSAPNTSTLALGVSNPVRNFSPLPNVKKELDAIVQQTPETTGIYPGLKFLNEAFSFLSLRDNLPGHKIVHIATHAQFTTGRPEDSFLVLGTGDRLTIPEIQTLKNLSQVQLVVLSACETALGGPDNEGTEISGISSYFLSGGAKAVMASLWAVDDASTSQFMQQFYRNLAMVKDPTTKAQALRQAQLGLLYGKGGFSHPYFWAPFVITGNGF